jgi:hypothetical protein
VVLCDGDNRPVDTKALELRLLKDLRSSRDYEPDYEDWSVPPPPPEDDPADSDLRGPVPDDMAFARFDPLVGGVCPMPRATEMQALEVIRAYQFNFDDEMVR